MPPPRPRAPPALPDELIEEILLRVPPDDPASIVHAALACRRWCRLVADPIFPRRRHELHRATPPILGVLCDIWLPGEQPSARFVPTSSCRPPHADLHGKRLLDARHGRVLFHCSVYRGYIVWDPITNQRVELPGKMWFLGNRSIKTTVLCAATGVCDHLNCHSGPFIVVLVGTNDIAVGNRMVPKNVVSCIYSSESGAWSNPTYHDHPGENFVTTRSALVGNTLFFALHRYERILKYDWRTQQTSVIRLPYVRTNTTFTHIVPIELTTLEDGRLGFARVEKSNELCMWSRGECDDVEGWTLCKVIDLKGLFPLVSSRNLKWSCLVGFAESVCVAFVTVQGGLFTIDMKSGLMKKVYDCPGICGAIPYINFCTPALDAPSREGGQTVGISGSKDGCLKCLES